MIVALVHPWGAAAASSVADSLARLPERYKSESYHLLTRGGVPVRLFYWPGRQLEAARLLRDVGLDTMQPAIPVRPLSEFDTTLVEAHEVGKVVNSDLVLVYPAS